MGIQVKFFSDESGVCTGLYIYYIHSYMYVYELPYVQNENPHQGRGVFYLCRCIVSRHSLEVQIFYGAFFKKKPWNALLCVKLELFIKNRVYD